VFSMFLVKVLVVLPNGAEFGRQWWHFIGHGFAHLPARRPQRQVFENRGYRRLSTPPGWTNRPASPLQPWSYSILGFSVR
jgi:hypothetical protein